MLDVKKIRKDFPMFATNPGLIYFDNSATSFKPQAVIDRITEFYTHDTVNVDRGDYYLSTKITAEYEKSRAVVANFINAAEANEIVFTSGASASLNLIALGFLKNYLKKGDVILTTLAEHASNILPLFHICDETGAIIRYIPLTDDGQLTVANFKKVMDKQVKFVSIAGISNVLGYINPIKEITKIAHEYQAVVALDGAQSVPHVKTDVQDLDVDFLAFSAHKMLGPSGLGVLYGKRAYLEQTAVLNYGGGSNARFNKEGEIILKDIPHRFESGTPAIEQVLAFKEAICYLEKIGMDEIEAYEKELNAYLLAGLKKLASVIIYNPNADTGIISINFKGIFAQDVAGYFSNHNICVRSGNHCAKILHNVICTNESIRISLYFYNTKEEIDEFLKVCETVTLENCIDIFI